MEKVVIHLFFAFIFLSMASCRKSGKSLQLSGSNAQEMQRVLDNYEDSMPLKRHAAEFIVSNMAGHSYYSSSAIDNYTDFVVKTKSLTSSSMRQRWDSLKASNQPVRIYDINTLSYNFVRDNIERAVAIWMQTPWHSRISEDVFMNYVLPYRVLDEPPSSLGWRDSLYTRYHHIIKGVNDVRMAFGKIHKYLLKEFEIHDIGGYPYLLSAMDAGKMKNGRCINQSAYIVAVMRALGIPASLEFIRNWANFSTNGHYWAALVTDKGTYTVKRDDSIARKYNVIDASVFSIKDTLEKDFAYDMSFKKRVSRIWRSSYKATPESTSYNDYNADKTTFEKFRNPFLVDVTCYYGYNRSVNINSLFNKQYAYLCTFITGSDWEPVAYSHNIFGCFSFSNVSDSVIYLPICYDANNIKSVIGEPFALTETGKKNFRADTVKLQTMTLWRKYPFSLLSAKSWPQARGACFEASNDEHFANVDTLCLITHSVGFRNEIIVDATKKYRYLRYRSHILRHAYISEIEIHSNGIMLKGKPLGEGVTNPNICFDGDTYSYVDNVYKGSWIGIDFGKPQPIDKLVLYPKNDGNNVVAGKRYLLYCFVAGKWKKYGDINSHDYKITFTDVPSGGVYRLHCIDGGNEEQIFTYENGRQIWW